MTENRVICEPLNRSETKTRKILRRLAGSLLLVMGLLSAALLLMRAAGISYYGILSGSMEPAIHTGAGVFVNRNASYDSVQEGDIIMFQAGSPNGSVMVCHRALSISESGIETKGDANKSPDQAIVSKNNYRGKVLFSIPGLWYVRTFFAGSVYGWILLAMIMFLLLFLVL